MLLQKTTNLFLIPFNKRYNPLSKVFRYVLSLIFKTPLHFTSNFWLFRYLLFFQYLRVLRKVRYHRDFLLRFLNYALIEQFLCFGMLSPRVLVITGRRIRLLIQRIEVQITQIVGRLYVQQLEVKMGVLDVVELRVVYH